MYEGFSKQSVLKDVRDLGFGVDGLGFSDLGFGFTQGKGPFSDYQGHS